MRRHLFALCAALAVALSGAFVLPVAQPASAQTASAPLRANLSAVMDNGTVTYSLTLANDSDTAVSQIYAAVQVPTGLTNFRVSATPTGAAFKGIELGAAAWIPDQVPAHGSVGPFSYQASVLGATPAAVNGFVHWLSPSDSSLLTSTVSPTMSGLPEGTIQITPVVPGMGEHWADPKNLPLGPIYGVYGGKIIFLEYMISQNDFRNGVKHTQLTGNKSLPAIDRIDFEFQPNGHEGYEVPHYDIHEYMISHSDHTAITPSSQATERRRWERGGLTGRRRLP